MTSDSNQTIDPPEGWCAQSLFGVLKTNTGARLVRLEDVHAWLMQRDGMPSASAVARVFGAFAADANSALGMVHGAEKVREALHFLDLSDYAEPVRGFAGRHFLREVAELMPYVPHHRFDRGTAGALMYVLGLIAGEVWAPHDVEIDLNDRLEGYCAEGYFPTVVKAREILGRFAVPFAAAHELWGWGTVAAAGRTTTAPPAALEDCDVISPEALVRYRGQFKGVKPVQKRPKWTARQREHLEGAVKLHGIPELLKLWGLESEEAVRGQLRKAKAEADDRAKPNVFACLMERSREA